MTNLNLSSQLTAAFAAIVSASVFVIASVGPAAGTAANLLV